MKPSINPDLKRVEISATRKILKKLQQARNDKEIISFGGGTPFLKPPAFLNPLVPKMFEEFSSHTYGVTTGIEELRELIAGELKGEGFREASAENVLLTASSTNGFDAALEAVTRKGDELVLVNPYFTNFRGEFELRKLKLKEVRTRVEEDYRINEEDLKKAITKKTRAVLVVSPDNPTGRVLSEKEVKLIGDLAVDNGAAILADEAYYKVCYAKKHHKFSNYLENLIGLRSYSKTLSMPGWRLGYNYASSELVKEMEKVNSFRVVCPGVFAQKLALECYKHPKEMQKYYEDEVRAYKTRRDALTNALREHLPQALFAEPEGGFYVFAKIKGIKDDEEFADDLFAEKKLAVVPGSAFGTRKSEGYARLSFVSETPERIREGVQRIASFLKQ